MPSIEFKEAKLEEVEDIKKEHYSIEEEKQKSELDRRIHAAEEKKELVKMFVDSLAIDLNIDGD